MMKLARLKLLAAAIGLYWGLSLGSQAFAAESIERDRVKLYSEKQMYDRLQPVGEVKLNGNSESRYYVQPVLFVPADQTESIEDKKAIDEAFLNLRQWYAGVLKQDQTNLFFQVEGVKVYRALKNTGYYKCPNHEDRCEGYEGLWGNVQDELRAGGLPLWQTGRIYIVFVKGGGGWAGSGCSPNCMANWPAPGPATETGVALLGDWALDGIAGKVNSECTAVLGMACNKEPQRGVIGHELGHTFGLAHAQNQMGSIMYDWWDFPNVALMIDPGNDEKAVLRTESKFFLKLVAKIRGRGKPVLLGQP